METTALLLAPLGLLPVEPVGQEVSRRRYPPLPPPLLPEEVPQLVVAAGAAPVEEDEGEPLLAELATIAPPNTVAGLLAEATDWAFFW